MYSYLLLHVCYYLLIIYPLYYRAANSNSHLGVVSMDKIDKSKFNVKGTVTGRIKSVDTSRFEKRMLNLKGIKLPSKLPNTAQQRVRGPKSEIIKNPLHATFKTCLETGLIIGEDYVLKIVDDIIHGVVSSFETSPTHRGNKLNVSVVRSILDKLEVISQRDIMENYGYSRQHAGLYLNACKLVIHFNKVHAMKVERAKLIKLIGDCNGTKTGNT